MPIQAPVPRAAARASRPSLGPTWADRTLARIADLRKSRRMGDGAKAGSYRELHLLISSGVDPGTVLDVLARARSRADERALYEELRRSLAQGTTLSGAFKLQGKFSNYEVQSMQVGEETGRLAEVFAELAEHFEAKVKLKRTLVSAFAYPGFVLGVTCCVIAFMLRVVVPMFSDVFKRSGAELPGLTRAVVRLSAVSGPVGIGALVAVAALVIMLVLMKDHARVQAFRSWVAVRAPLVGPIYRKAQFARLYRAMASMLAAQLPLDRALDLSCDLVDLRPLRQALIAIRERVVRGGHLHEACAEHPLFDRRDVAMIAVAEEVRQLDRMFLRLAAERMAEVQHRTSLMGSVLEPVMIVFIAVFVGIVLVAMYLPMFKLSTAF